MTQINVKKITRYSPEEPGTFIKLYELVRKGSIKGVEIQDLRLLTLSQIELGQLSTSFVIVDGPTVSLVFDTDGNLETHNETERLLDIALVRFTKETV
jgi:hypothetical protein